MPGRVVLPAGDHPNLFVGLFNTCGLGPARPGSHRPGVLFVFEIPESEAAFLDIADGMDGLDVITANAGALGEHGILGEAWSFPPSHSLDRRPLAALYPVPKVQSFCAVGFL